MLIVCLTCTLCYCVLLSASGWLLLSPWLTAFLALFFHGMLHINLCWCIIGLSFASLSLSTCSHTHSHTHYHLLLWWNLRNSRPRFLMLILWLTLCLAVYLSHSLSRCRFHSLIGLMSLVWAARSDSVWLPVPCSWQPRIPAAAGRRGDTYWTQ